MVPRIPNQVGNTLFFPDLSLEHEIKKIQTLPPPLYGHKYGRFFYKISKAGHKNVNISKCTSLISIKICTVQFQCISYRYQLGTELNLALFQNGTQIYQKSMY
jgi:hypothetical protein